MSKPGAKPGMFRNMYSAGILNCSRLSRSRSKGFMNSYQRPVSAVGIAQHQVDDTDPGRHGHDALLRAGSCHAGPSKWRRAVRRPAAQLSDLARGEAQPAA